MLRFFTPPVFKDDEEKTRIAGVLVRALTAIYLLLPVALFLWFLNPNTNFVYTGMAIGLTVTSTILIWITHRGYVRSASAVLIGILVIFSTVSDLSVNGEPRPITVVSGAAIVIGGLLLGARGAFATAILFSLKHIGVLLVVNAGLFQSPVVNPPPPPFADGVSTTAGYIIIAIIFNLASASLQSALTRARSSEESLSNSNRQLQELTRNLEGRIQERTSELERRAVQLEAISRVARSISTVQDLDRLLPSITHVVSEQFGFYHTGIFLLDERSEYAVLAAANSEGGQRMLKRGHRLRLGATGIVGYVAAQGEPRIALDVGADSVYFNNPDLPQTRSEMALPLKAGSSIIGVLDVQSTETNAFQPTDISVLATLASQIAIAIENAQLFSRTRKALAESQSVYDEYIKREWAQFQRKVEQTGFAYDGIRATPISAAATEEDISGTKIPIKIRGVIVGTISIRSNNPARTWSQDEINLVQSAAERAGLAIENIRLLEEAQRRAAKERTIGEISSRLAASIDMSAIMQTAVQELGRALPGSEIVLQFENEKDKAA